MARLELIDEVSQDFQNAFGTAPDATAYAPGRVNLLGEHTDYNGGYVLPMPLALGSAVAIRFGQEGSSLQAASASFHEIATRDLNDRPNDTWTDYIIGSLGVYLEGQRSRDIQIAVASDLPVGSGLSSSAALEVGTMRAAAQALGLPADPVEIAKMARKAENDFVGVPCGIMDQFSVSVGTPGDAIFLATRELTYEKAPIPDSHNLVIVHSGVPHKLSDDGYETRVKECAAACEALGVEMLSDLSLDDIARIEALDAPLLGRARHIVTENDRVVRGVKALSAGDAQEFAKLMLASHASQRDDYEVSLPEIDALVEGAVAAGATGARLTGGGFGGSIVAFVEKTRVPEFCKEIEAKHPKARVKAIT